MRAEELAQLPDDGWRYELVEGRLVRMSPTGRRHSRVGVKLFPQTREVEVWRPGQPPATVIDKLHGEDVLPGFAHPLAGLFD